MVPRSLSPDGLRVHAFTHGLAKPADDAVPPCLRSRGARQARIDGEGIFTKEDYFWRPPGWTHDGSRDTSDTIRARWQARQMAEPAE